MMRCTLCIALLVHRALADDAAHSAATVARFRSDAACAVVAGDPSPSRCCPSYALAASAYRYHTGVGAETEGWVKQLFVGVILYHVRFRTIELAAGRPHAQVLNMTWHGMLTSLPERNAMLMELLRIRPLVAQMAKVCLVRF